MGGSDEKLSERTSMLVFNLRHGRHTGLQLGSFFKQNISLNISSEEETSACWT